MEVVLYENEDYEIYWPGSGHHGERCTLVYARYNDDDSWTCRVRLHESGEEIGISGHRLRAVIRLRV